jgi:RNA polymerase sigma-70 factor (ECF subfamily)
VDPAAFTDVFRAQYAYVFTTLRRLGVAPRDLPDVTQEVFVTVASILEDYDEHRPIKPWLFGIAYRIALRHRALARHRREVFAPVEEQAPDSTSKPDAQLAAAEERALVHEALSRVEVSKRAVLLLCDLEGQTAPVAAETLGIPLNTAYSRLRLARKEFEAAVKILRARRRER